LTAAFAERTLPRVHYQSKESLVTEPNKNPSPERVSATDSKQTVAPLTDLVKDLDAGDTDRIKGGASVKKTMST
jgi:hypothetical protein